MAEIKAARNDPGRIKVTAGLYLLSKTKSGAETMKKVRLINSMMNTMTLKLCQIPQVYFSLKFDDTMMIYDALGDILVDAQAFHRKSFPIAKPLQRFMIICLFALCEDKLMIFSQELC